MGKLGAAWEMRGIVMLLAKGGNNLRKGEWASGLAEVHAAALKGITRVAKNFADRLGTQAANNSVPVLSLASYVMFPLGFMVGPGDEKGGRLESGALEFEKAGNALQLAIADPSFWSGEAAEAYNAQTEAQLPRLTEMERIDRALIQIIADQAAECHKVNQAVQICDAVVTAAIPIALLLKAIQPGGDAVSMAFQIATALATVGASVTEIGIQVANAESHKAAIDLLKIDYENQGSGAHLDGAEDVQVKVGSEGETSIDSVDGLMSGAGGVPPVFGARGAGSGTTNGSPSGDTAEGADDSNFGAADAGAGDWNSGGGDFGTASADTGAGPQGAAVGAPPMFGGVPRPGQGTNAASQGSRPGAQSPTNTNDTSSMFPDGQTGSGDSTLAGQFDGAGAGADDTGRAPVGGGAGAQAGGAAQGSGDSERAPVDVDNEESGAEQNARESQTAHAL